MEEFAFIDIDGSENRYIDSHPFLRHIPKKWARSIISKTKSRFTETIYNKGDHDRLGYILDVPGFFMDEDKGGYLNLGAVLENIIKTLETRALKILVFPRWADFLGLKEVEYLGKRSIILLDGQVVRFISLLETFERILLTIKAQPHRLTMGLWGGDNYRGKMWAELMAPHTNDLILGGQDIKALEELGNEILKKTGLSCQISNSLSKSCTNRTLTVLNSIPQERPKLDSPSIIICLFELSAMAMFVKKKAPASIIIESGWFCFPEGMDIDNSLKPWDRIGILEALLFIKSEKFRKLFSPGGFNWEGMKMGKDIMESEKVEFSNMVSMGEVLSYNEFRRLYF